MYKQKINVAFFFPQLLKHFATACLLQIFFFYKKSSHNLGPITNKALSALKIETLLWADEFI